MRLGDSRRWIVLLPVALTACASIVGDFTFAGSSSSSGASTSSSSSGVGGTTATSSTSTSSSSSSGMTVDCLALATTRCTQMKACAPYVYQATYGSTSPANDMLCASEAARVCALPPLFDNTNPGVTDPVACQAALAGDCPDYLVAVDQPPAACLPAPGNAKTNESCVDQSQCVAGDICWTDGPSYCPSYCGPALPTGTRCGYDQFDFGGPGPVVCDYRNGVTCVIPSGMTGYYYCTQLPHGGAGAVCVPGACKSGLACTTQLTGTETCVALLAEGAACTADMLGLQGPDPCDTRLGLHCIANPDGMGSSCQPNDIVPVGSVCGSVTDAGPDGGTLAYTQVCDAYSYCSTANVCTPKSKLGEPCTDASVCYPGYACTAATCQLPVAPTDPTCTAELTVPLTSLECGTSHGGLPRDCGVPGSDGGTACCVGGADDIGDAGVTTVCATGNACPYEQRQFFCDDSSECGAGNVCCLSFTPGDFVSSACVSGTSCSGYDWEICRMDNPTPCASTGMGCLVATTASTWSNTLPPSVGFCSAEAVKPACLGPGSGCKLATDCCSNSCSSFYGCD